jgi:hypothetical protein
MVRHIARCLLILGVLALAQGLLSAGVILVYTDRTAWQTAVGTYQTETFESVAPGPLPAGTSTLGLLTFYADVADASFLHIAVEWNGTQTLTSDIWKPANGGGTTQTGLEQFIFGSPITAWGADFYGASTGALLIIGIGQMDLNLVTYLPNPGTGFFGVITTGGFTVVSLRANGGDAVDEWFGMDNVSFSSISGAVPEPGTAALVVLGLAVGAFLRRKRRA